MILAVFVLENSYISLLGILIGILLGIDVGCAFAVSPNSGLTFVIPWQQILEIVGLAYALSMLATIALRAEPREYLLLRLLGIRSSFGSTFHAFSSWFRLLLLSAACSCFPCFLLA